ncbi:MAG: thiamine-phosphate synthase family protein [Methanoregulaceae archaeon]
MADNEEIEMFGRMMIALGILESSREFGKMIPEVRSNMVFAKTSAKTRDDVLAIDGRITVVSGMPRASGRPRFGASSHMARLLIELRKVDPSVRAGIDFANTPEFSEWLREYCARKGWAFAMINRANEPEEIKAEEGASMPWKAAAVIRAAGGKVPKVFYENGAVGKEPVSVIVGAEPIGVARELCELIREYLRLHT